MKKYKKEKLELLMYAQDVNMYAESFSALYEEVKKDTSTDLEVQDKNSQRLFRLLHVSWWSSH